jgi:hypothetical protein
MKGNEMTTTCDLIQQERTRAIAALREQLKDIKRQRKETRARFKWVRPVSTMNRTTPKIVRGQQFQRELDNLAWLEYGAASQLAQLVREAANRRPDPQLPESPCNDGSIAV